MVDGQNVDGQCESVSQEQTGILFHCNSCHIYAHPIFIKHVMSGTYIRQTLTINVNFCVFSSFSVVKRQILKLTFSQLVNLVRMQMLAES